jgi:thiamine-phosphate pyrophosphorylase
VRRIVGPDRLVGLSTHTVEQVRASAARREVDYIGFGPVFATTSKARPDPVTGPAALRAAAAAARHPIVAIGGLTPDRVRELDPSAWHCIAAIRAVADADDPAAALRRFQNELENQA